MAIPNGDACSSNNQIVSNLHLNSQVRRTVGKPSQISVHCPIKIDCQGKFNSVWKRYNRGKYWWAQSRFTFWAMGIYLYVHYAVSLSFLPALLLSLQQSSLNPWHVLAVSSSLKKRQKRQNAIYVYILILNLFLHAMQVMNGSFAGFLDRMNVFNGQAQPASVCVHVSVHLPVCVCINQMFTVCPFQEILRDQCSLCNWFCLITVLTVGLWAIMGFGRWKAWSWITPVKRPLFIFVKSSVRWC